MDQESSVVLVVDDERDLADLFTEWLSGDYAVRTAYSGQQAFDELDEDVDVVLLDRRMPELSGDDVLAAVRERGFDCRVAMVTAVDPDFDILEMGFDEYLTKPVTSDDLHEVVATLLDRKRHDTAVQRYFQLVTKRTALEAQMGAGVTGHQKYEALQDEIESLEAELDELTASFADDDFETQLRRIGGGAGRDGTHTDDAHRPDAGTEGGV